MNLLTLIIVFVVAGLLLYLVERFIPMDPLIKKWLPIIVFAILIIWVLSLFGVFDSLRTVRVGS